MQTQDLQNVLTSFQLGFTILGGGYALFQLVKSNKEKKTAFIFSIFNRIYDDKEISSVLYAADKNEGLDELQKKVLNKDIKTAFLEKETDKTLHFLNYIGRLIKDNHIDKKDLTTFTYEIKTILENEIIRDYISYLKSIKVNLDNLKYLV